MMDPALQPLLGGIAALAAGAVFVLVTPGARPSPSSFVRLGGTSAATIVLFASVALALPLVAPSLDVRASGPVIGVSLALGSASVVLLALFKRARSQRRREGGSSSTKPGGGAGPPGSGQRDRS